MIQVASCVLANSNYFVQAVNVDSAVHCEELGLPLPTIITGFVEHFNNSAG